MKRALVALAAVLVALACSDVTRPSLSRSDEPMLYIVLTRDPGSRTDEPVDSALSALLLTTGTPIAAEYRTAEQFTMRRVGDGAVLDWQWLPKSGTIRTPGTTVSFPDGGNLRLPWAGAGPRMGRRDLVGGDTYDLDVVSRGRTIHGRVVIPEQPAPQIVAQGTRTLVVWHAVRGAAKYLVAAETERSGGGATSDTVYILQRDANPALIPASPRISVTALDSNLWRYYSDTLVVSAGVQGAYGVFGALSRATIAIP